MIVRVTDVEISVQKMYHKATDEQWCRCDRWVVTGMMPIRTRSLGRLIEIKTIDHK